MGAKLREAFIAITALSQEQTFPPTRSMQRHDGKPNTFLSEKVVLGSTQAILCLLSIRRHFFQHRQPPSSRAID
jgi:hypothetical protein